METAQKAISLIDQVQALVSAQDLTMFMYVSGMALAGAIVNVCWTKHETFKQSAANFFGSMIFGAMAGTLSLMIYSKIAYPIAALFSLFGKKTYEKMENKLPEALSKRAKKIIDNES